MRRLSSVLLIALLAACSGGGGAGSTTPATSGGGISNPPPGPQSVATSSMTFRVPFTNHTRRVPSNLGRHDGVKPMYVSAYSNGYFTVIFDGQKVIDEQSFAPTLDSNGNPIPGPGPSGSHSMPNGGSFSYTSTVTLNNGVGYVAVSASYTTIPGSHTVGVVQDDGPCVPDQYKRELCIANTDHFVLAEGQTTLNLRPGNNGSTALFLRGVIESAYLCDAACDGQVGTPDANNVYHLTAYAADESGSSITQQIDPSTHAVVPFDNGGYVIAETDSNNIVTIGGVSGTYTAPGSDDPNGPYGQNFTIQCNQVGQTTVAMMFAPGSPSAGNVSGYTYTADNYPQPQTNPILGPVGADEYFGNTLIVNCTASGNIIIQ